jgi:hypothetical protein
MWSARWGWGGGSQHLHSVAATAAAARHCELGLVAERPAGILNYLSVQPAQHVPAPRQHLSVSGVHNTASLQACRKNATPVPRSHNLWNPPGGYRGRVAAEAPAPSPATPATPPDYSRSSPPWRPPAGREKLRSRRTPATCPPDRSPSGRRARSQRRCPSLCEVRREVGTLGPRQ